jgi:hypothetical protein
MMVTIDAVNGGFADLCGSGLAREGVVSVDNIAGNADAFASKPAPTGFHVPDNEAQASLI